MGKVKELSAFVDEIRKCGETLVDIADGLADMFSTNKEEESIKQSVAEEKTLTCEDVRAVLAEKSRKGYTADVKVLLIKYGANKLSDIDPAKYKELLSEVEVLGNAE